MTNHWVDLQNCKTILVEGSNVAENHPMAYKWIRKAQENGAKLIHVDPRYTRTSAGADIYARIRPGTDAAFQNTMINHIIVNKLYDEDYVVTHTNALYLGDEAFDFKDGAVQRLRRGAPQVRHQDLGIPARREGLSAHRQEPGRSALRVLAAEDVRLALHAGDGRAHHRHSGRSDPADRRDDGEEPAGIDPLCARDDPAHDRRAGHPLVHDPAAPARQHRQAGRRRQRAARRAERAGRVRHGRALQLHAGLPQLADQCRADDLPLRAQERHRRQPLPRQHAQGIFRRRGHRGERLLLRVAAQARCRQGLRHAADVRGRPRREAEDDVDRRPESRRHAAQPQVDVRCDGEARDARRPGDLGNGDRGVLEAAGRRSEDPSTPR